MSFLIYASDFILPIVFVIIIVYGYLKKVEIYDIFIGGAKDGLMIVFGILPTLVGLLLAVALIRASGALDGFAALISPITSAIGFPTETVPLLFMRMVSSSAATGLMLDLFNQFGPDSFIGRFISITMGCTETILYTLSIYFTSIGIKKMGYTLPAAIIANFFAVALAFYITVAVF